MRVTGLATGTRAALRAGGSTSRPIDSTRPRTTEVEGAKLTGQVIACVVIAIALTGAAVLLARYLG